MLANKYRPQTFSEFVGQEIIVGLIRQSILQNKISQSVLLSGMHGIGKTSLARVMAKAMNCSNRTKDGEPCNKCQNCELITKGNHPDVTEVDAASHTSVDHMRNIISNSQYLPIQAKYKVNIIDEAHMLSESAFNSLLKTLEEPGKSVVFILATTKQEKIPETIISRCQRYALTNVDIEKVKNHLINILDQEKIKYDASALQNIAHASQGSVRNAIVLLEQVMNFSEKYISDDNVKNMLDMQHDDQVRQLLQQIVLNEQVHAIQTIRSLFVKCQPQVIVTKLLEMLHQLIVMSYIRFEHPQFDNGNNIINTKYQELSSLLDRVSTLAAHRLWCIGWKHMQNLNYRLIPEAVLEVMVIEMMYSFHVLDAQTLIKKIQQQKGAAEPRQSAGETIFKAQAERQNSQRSSLAAVHTALNANNTKIDNHTSRKSHKKTTHSSSENEYNKITQSKEMQELYRELDNPVIEVHKKSE